MKYFLAEVALPFAGLTALFFAMTNVEATFILIGSVLAILWMFGTATWPIWAVAFVVYVWYVERRDRREMREDAARFRQQQEEIRLRREAEVQAAKVDRLLSRNAFLERQRPARLIFADHHIEHPEQGSAPN
jgi:uncharacterized membrane protein